MITKLLGEGDQIPNVDLDRELYTTALAQQLPVFIEHEINNLASRLNSDLNALKVQQTPKDLKAWLQELNYTPILNGADDSVYTLIKSEMSRVRGLMTRSKNVLQKWGFPTVWADDILKNFEGMFHKPYSPLTPKERAELIHMVEDSIFFQSRR